MDAARHPEASAATLCYTSCHVTRRPGCGRWTDASLSHPGCGWTIVPGHVGTASKLAFLPGPRCAAAGGFGLSKWGCRRRGYGPSGRLHRARSVGFAGSHGQGQDHACRPARPDGSIIGAREVAVPDACHERASVAAVFSRRLGWRLVLRACADRRTPKGGCHDHDGNRCPRNNTWVKSRPIPR